MTLATVQPIKRSGGWSGFQRLYRKAAHEAIANVRESHRILGETWKRLDAPGGEAVLPEYLRQLEAYIVLTATAEIYCAMAVEALLNFYGVCRLGEEFYVRNLERGPILAKLELLLATCDGLIQPKDAELCILLRRLSQRRNQLVHPKSREFRIDRVPPANWADEAPKAVEQTVADMEKFFTVFGQINENTKAAVEFSNAAG